MHAPYPPCGKNGNACLVSRYHRSWHSCPTTETLQWWWREPDVKQAASPKNSSNNQNGEVGGGGGGQGGGSKACPWNLKKWWEGGDGGGGEEGGSKGGTCRNCLSHISGGLHSRDCVSQTESPKDRQGRYHNSWNVFKLCICGEFFCLFFSH